MNIDTLKLTVQIFTLTVAAVGIPLVVISLRHARSSNFVAAWLAISDRLQSTKILQGRILLRCLHYRKRGEEASEQDHLDAFSDMKKYYSSNHWWNEFEKEYEARSTTGDKVAWLSEFMAEAVGAFDLIGILAINSRIPELLDVVVLEWLDSILACFEQGKWVVCRRLNTKRFEQFQCFSVLYIRARRRQEELMALHSRALIGDPYPSSRGWSAWLMDRQLSDDAEAAAHLRESICPR